MNIVRIVKETVLLPRRIIEGFVEGIDETVNGPKKGEKK